MEGNLNTMNMEDISKLFYEMMHIEEEEVDDICYISGECLENDSIKLKCNHAFNYNHIFNEVCSQKSKSSSYNKLNLKINQLQCPYCRNIQNEILPYKCGGIRKHGVNYPEHYTMKPNKCSYVMKSGSRKRKVCNTNCYFSHCNRHMKYLFNNDVDKYCTATLKSGKNKGKSCGCKVFANGYCKRHNKT